MSFHMGSASDHRIPLAVARFYGEQRWFVDAVRRRPVVPRPRAHAAILVSLVQTADMLPDVLFGIVGGVLADTLDRRRLLIAVQVGLVVATSILAALTIAGRMTPALLLTFTFVIGTGSVLGIPAYQSLVPDLVPRNQINAAAQLSSINVNLARAVGPAIAGILISHSRGGWRLCPRCRNVSCLWPGCRPLASRREHRHLKSPRGSSQHFAPAAATCAMPPSSVESCSAPGSFSFRRAPFGRSSPSSPAADSDWARAGTDLLLASLGIGAVTGAAVLSKVRARLSSNGVIELVGAVFGAALVAVILVRSTVFVVIVLIPAGMAWVGMLATVNTLLQLFLPSWVRARGLSVYQMVLFGAQGLGALLWGVVADSFGLTLAFLVAAGLTISSAASIHLWPFVDTSGMDRRILVRPDPVVEIDPESSSGPIVVRTVYSISADREIDFARAHGLRSRVTAPYRCYTVGVVSQQ